MNDFEGRIWPLFCVTASALKTLDFEANCVKLVEDKLILSAIEM